MKKIFFAIFFLAVLKSAKSNSLPIKFINTFEEILMSIRLKNCTDLQEFKSKDHHNLQYMANLKMKTVFLKQIIGNEEDRYLLLNAAEGIFASSRYNRSLSTTILIHGFFGTLAPSTYIKIAKALYDTKTTNVFVMDHRILLSTSYFAASTFVRFIGETLGKVLSNLYESHSLGAHISAFAGKVFKERIGIKLNRITGLDPAEICFFYEVEKSRLTSSDADFVDIIHSDIDLLGIDFPIGHVDFYPNGGKNMTGCTTNICSHLRAGFYYAESIYNNQFLALSCPNWDTFKSGACINNSTVHMGYWTPSSARGSYYLLTNSSSNFSKGIEGIAKPIIIF